MGSLNDNVSFTVSTVANTTGCLYYPPVTPTDPFQPSIPYVWTDWSQNNKKEDNMRGLFSVFIVDPKDGEIIYKEIFIAKNADDAKLKAVKEADLDGELDDYDIGVFCYGMFIRAKKEVQKVKIVKDED